MSKLYLPTKEQMDTMNENLGKIAAAVGSQVDISTWAGIQKAVRSGIAKDILPIGTQLSVNHSVYGSCLFDVVAHDYLKNVNDPDGHTMTIMQHDLFASIQFDAPEALYYAETQLAAGTYCFNVAETYGAWLSGTYSFTLTQAVPADGQLCISGNRETELTSLQIQSYTSRTAANTIESVTITSESNGISLGTLGEGKLNHIQRVSYGSNNYKESAIRQFLNSSAAAGKVWTPQIKFDRPPSWATTLDGYKAGLDQDFLAVVCKVVLPCVTNSVYEAPDSTVVKNTKYTLNDEFYLASRREIFGTNESVADDSIIFPFYDGATAADRIKYRDGSAAGWWLRTPYVSLVSGIRVIRSDGTLYNGNARTANGLAPACTIG